MSKIDFDASHDSRLQSGSCRATVEPVSPFIAPVVWLRSQVRGVMLSML